jgi:hypothetical protein
VKRRTVVAALSVLLCLSCSWGSDIIIANTADTPLTVRAEYEHWAMRDSVLPIRFADVDAISGYDSWRDAPASAVAVDMLAGTLHMTIPPKTAASIASARTCGSAATCDHFPLLSVELSGRSGSVRADGVHLRAAFSSESRYRWILWYPLTGAHGFWQNLGRAQALMLCTAIVVVGFTLWTAVLIARTEMPHRWGWVVVALLGIGKVAINWTTGEMGTTLFSLPLFGGSISRSGAIGPWIVAFTFPLGAIMALYRRSRVLDAARPAPLLESEGAAAGP